MGACNGTGYTPADEETFEVREAGFSIAVRTNRRMGWQPDLPDFRDRVLALPEHKTRSLPSKKDLRDLDPHFPIYDQGELGSCTANAIGAAVHFDMVKLNLEAFTPSRLFVYYNERAIMGTTDEDSGAQIRDGMKTLHKIGVCSEDLWAYDVDRFKDRPTSDCYTQAALHKASEYASVPQDLNSLRGCINEGYPFVFGFIVFSSFQTKEVATTGHMRMPRFWEKMLGGHAVMACGYDDHKKVFIVRNSWGTEWGDEGYFYMPYDYMTHPFLVRDIWVLRVIDGIPLPTERKMQF